jgi:hypothetical protein
MSVSELIQLITALGVLLTALGGLRNGRKIKEVHNAVNPTEMAQNARTDQLTATLTQAGIDVPARPTDTPAP